MQLVPPIRSAMRWISPDPVTSRIYDPQSLNKYTYVRNDPVNLIDPNGKWAISFELGYLIQLGLTTWQEYFFYLLYFNGLMIDGGSAVVEATADPVPPIPGVVDAENPPPAPSEPSGPSSPTTPTTPTGGGPPHQAAAGINQMGDLDKLWSF
jgi:hypothetical protein